MRQFMDTFLSLLSFEEEHGVVFSPPHAVLLTYFIYKAGAGSACFRSCSFMALNSGGAV